MRGRLLEPGQEGGTMITVFKVYSPFIAWLAWAFIVLYLSLA